MDLSKTIFEKYTQKIFDVPAQGETTLQQAFYLIHFGDWLSYYLSVENDVDPIEIEAINFLKGELAKVED